MENCSVEGVIISSGGYIGGVAGLNAGIVRNCFAAVDVTGLRLVGGVAGINGYPGFPGILDRCYATGAVKATDVTDGAAGGVIRASAIGSVQNCVALNGSVETGSDPSRIGRVVGIDPVGSSIILNNYARNDMTVTVGSGVYTVAPDPDGEDGADVSAAQYNTQSFWEGLGYDFSITGPWIWNTILQLPVI